MENIEWCDVRAEYGTREVRETKTMLKLILGLKKKIGCFERALAFR
jgi:hypothetical protein